MSSLVVALVTDGVSATALTFRTNVSLIVTGTPPVVFVMVTVIVLVPDWFVTGVIDNCLVAAVSGPIVMFAFGTNVVLLEVAVIESNDENESPMRKIKTAGVSSPVVLSLMSSRDGSASNAPMSTV